MDIGDKVPELFGLDEEGREVRLSDYAGRRLALYFYPKDNTPGCTAEACSLRDHYEELRAAGFDVVGVSTDSAASHRRFRDRNGLPFRLVADTGHALAEMFGVWVEKKLYGRSYMGIARTTFVISPDGCVEKIIGPKEIKTKTHGEQLLGTGIAQD